MNTTKQPRLSPSELHAIKQINSDETIIILPADKGRATVILDKAAYTEKANILLKDTTTYQPSKTDAAKKMNQRTKSKLESLRNSGAISKKVPLDKALRLSTRQVLRTAENQSAPPNDCQVSRAILGETQEHGHPAR